MPQISQLNKSRIKFFCALLDVWSKTMVKNDDADPDEKMGAIIKKGEEIKLLVINENPSPKLITVPVDAIMEPGKILCWKTDEQALKKTQNSIERFGLKNYPVVQKFNGRYQLVSGAMPYEACKNLKMQKIQVLLKNFNDSETRELALLDAIGKIGLQDLDPKLMNETLKFYNQLLN